MICTGDRVTIPVLGIQHVGTVIEGEYVTATGSVLVELDEAVDIEGAPFPLRRFYRSPEHVAALT